MRRIALLLALLFGAANSAFAVNYYWDNGPTPGGAKYTADSPNALCSAIVAGLASENARGQSVSYGSETIFYCNFTWSAGNQASVIMERKGDGCAGTYDPATGVCSTPKPTDAECKTRDNYTKIIQFSFVDGRTVLSIDPEIKDSCVYDPGLPKNCTSTQCEFDMTPAGNDDMSDNPDNPDQQLQDYLDELAKKFDCVKTVNGNVGCTNAQQTPPDVDPEDKCFPGYSWSGTTCVATPGGPAENNNSGSGSGGGNTGGGNTGGGNTGGGNTGGGDTGGGNGDGGGDTGGGSDGDKDNSVEGMACEMAFKCNGDAIACAQAEKQKQMYCEAHELNDSEKGFGKIGEELGAEKYQPNEGEDIDVSDLFGQGARFLPASCPAIQTVSLSIGPLSLDWEPVCYYAEILGNFGVAMCSLFFGLYVGRAFGGE